VLTEPASEPLEFGVVEGCERFEHVTKGTEALMLDGHRPEESGEPGPIVLVECENAIADGQEGARVRGHGGRSDTAPSERVSGSSDRR
jgi:hypothetical protein